MPSWSVAGAAAAAQGSRSAAVDGVHPRNTSAACQSSSSGSGWSSSAGGTAMARPAKCSYSRPPAKVVGELVAHAEAIVGREGDVAGVIQTVDVGARQQPVGERVRAAIRVGTHARPRARAESARPRAAQAP